MKSLQLAIAIHLSAFLFSQELLTVKFNSEEINKETSPTIVSNWRLITEGNSVYINNGRIRNNTNTRLNNLQLQIYLATNPFGYKSGFFEGYKVIDVPLNPVEKKSELAIVNLNASVDNLPPEGQYFPVYVLLQNKNIVSIISPTEKVDSKSGSLFVVQPTIKASNATGIMNPNPKVKLELENNNSLVLLKDWKIDVDFKNFLVKIIGGDIANNSSEDIKKFKIDVFLTEEKQEIVTKNFNGLLIATAPIELIEKNKTFVDTTLTTGLLAIPKSGKYYIILTISSPDENGNYIVRSTKTINSTLSF